MFTSKSVILVVDDYADLRATMQRMLEGDGHHVITAANGAEGFAALLDRRGCVDAVVLDLYMPKLNGLHFAELVRIAWPAVPILIVSAYAEISQVQEAIARLQLPILAKPFTKEALIGAVTGMMV